VRFRALPLFSAVLATAFLITTEAAAQGRGRPKAPKTPSQTLTPLPSDSAVSTPTAVTTFRQCGSWLDDASAPTPGEGRTGIGIGYWRVAGGSQIDVPMLDVGYGFTSRLQASASVPFYRASFTGATDRGLDDVYLSAKFTAIDPAARESQFGLAISPVMEILSSGGADGRVHFALPVSMELRRQPFRVYGSAGYFSRGSFFSGGALEWATSSGMMLTGALTQSYSMKEDSVLDALGLGKQRVDVTAGVAYPVMSVAAAYVAVGRSLTSIDEGGTSLSLAGGVSFRFSTSKATP
jgi:hypothetical protein